MERDPQNLKINQAVFEKKINGFLIGKWQEEGEDLSGIGQLPSEWQEKTEPSLAMGEIIP